MSSQKLPLASALIAALLSACGTPSQRPVRSEADRATTRLSQVTSSTQSRPLFAPPMTRKDSTVDTLFGEPVADPFRWFEKGIDDPEVKAWVDEQNALTRKVEATWSSYASFEKRISELLDRDRSSGYVRRGNKLIFSQQKKGEEQGSQYVKNVATNEVKPFLNVTELSDDPRAQIADSVVSHDGRYVLTAVNLGGADLNTYRIKDLESGAILPDSIESAFFSASWSSDSKGFYYQQFTLNGGLDGVRRSLGIYYHAIGTPSSQDVRIYATADTDDSWVSVMSTVTTGSYLVISNYNTVSTVTTYHVIDTAPGASTVPLKLPVEYKRPEYWRFVGISSGRMHFHTDNGAPSGRIVALPFDGTSFGALEEVIAASTDVIEGAVHMGERLVLQVLRNGLNGVIVFDLNTRRSEEIALPGPGTVYIDADRASNTLIYTFDNEITPETAFERDFTTGTTRIVSNSDFSDVDLSAYASTRVVATSKDGTKIPVYVVHKKGIKLDGSHPTIMYGYGGFSVNIIPYFSPSRLAWLEKGGVFATVQLRGGSEFGSKWRAEGIREKKQNVFDDFIAAGEALITAGYTSARRLGINGGSNGGLLVGAVLNQRPDLFGAALPDVGVMDMLRFHKFTVGSNWIADYGNPDVEADFKAARAYSPLHNIDSRKSYPPVLVRTGARDDRVVPAHSFKYAAALQEATSGKSMTLISVVEEGSHGGATGTSADVRERSQFYSFFYEHLAKP